MALKTPQQATQKWASQMAQATEAYSKGVQSVTTDPAEAAVAQQSRLIQNFMASVNSGAWANGLRAAAAKGTWKANALSKGVARIGPGAAAAIPKMMAHQQSIFPVNQQLQAQLAQMPKGGKENAKARFSAMLDAYDQFKAAKRASA